MTRVKKVTKPYWEMNTQELAEATAEFDRPIDPGKLRPLTPEMAAAWERAKRKPGRPRVGQGVKVISLSVERGLLRDCDALAKRMGLRRSAFIDMSLRTYISRMESPAPRVRRARKRGRSKATAAPN